MRREHRIGLWLAGLGVLALLAAPGVPAALQQSMCFGETDQCLGGEFQEYWLHNGGLPVFGYPIQNARGYADHAQGESYSLQWFERNRLEYHARNPAPYTVLLGRLGDERLRQLGRDPAREPVADPATAHYFAPTRHAIAGPFWSYWRAHGLDLGDPDLSARENLALFGYPITEPQMETNATGDTVLTQWFERARFEYHPDKPDPYKVLLGLLGNEVDPHNPQRALDRINVARALIGAPALQFHPAIMQATSRHAQYILQNFGDPAANTYGPHGEVAGKAGYSGQWPSDRIKTAGYPWFGGAEVMHFIGDPAASAEDWLATIYHRAIVLDPNARYTGYGGGARSQLVNGERQLFSVDVMDFGGVPDAEGMPFPLGYPADGQIGVPTYWGGGEAPDPLPGGAARPVGYPFTLQGGYGPLHVDSAELQDGAGHPVAVHPNPPDCIRNGEAVCYALIAVTPLQPHTTYVVHAQGTVKGMPFDRTWHFTTAALVAPSR